MKLLKHPLVKKVVFTTVAGLVAAIVIHQVSKKTTGLVDDD